MDLPPNIAYRLEQTLAQWQHWSKPAPPGAPHIEHRLGNGLSNHNVLVTAADKRYVVRLDRARPAANGLNRQAEWRALHAAHSAGIAPRPCYFNPELGVLVCEYLAPDPEQVWTLDALAELLRGIHEQPQVRFRMEPVERMRRYERQLPRERQHLATLGEAVRARMPGNQGPLSLCHHDLNPANLLLSGGTLYALDWEYCAMGSPWFDLAVVMQECLSEASEREALLAHYLGRPAGLEDRQALELHGIIARYLALLWFATDQGEAVAGEDLAQRESDLRSLLQLNP